MTEAEWLASDFPRELIRPFRPGEKSRRRLTLYAVAGARIHEGIERQRPLWDAVEAAERATDDGDWTEVDRLFAASVASMRPEVGSAARDWAQATMCLTSSGLHILEVPGKVARAASGSVDRATHAFRRLALAALVRDIFGNPFRPVTFSPEWRTSTVVALAEQIYESRDFTAMPILADALQDAGCENVDILDHCRGSGPHVRGCWVVDRILGKE